MREYRFDVVRVVCMTYLVTFVHLYQYIYPEGRMTSWQPASIGMAHACLGVFTFVSGYLLGTKYSFGQEGNTTVWLFYKKRLLRIFPLFLLASLALWLIDFNDTASTLNGILCISPFVDPKPMTLYYIPVILWCYLITPLLSRHGLRWRLTGSLLVVVLLVAARYFFPSIDNRFVFNVFFYMVGLVTAPCFDWKSHTPYGNAFKTAAVLTFVCLLAYGISHSLFDSNAAQMALGALGVFVILFVCEAISHLLFSPTRRGTLILIVSYASMATYMFHRFFYWAAERIWNPTDTTVKWLFMIVVVYPLILLFSWAIQKLYDKKGRLWLPQK